MVVFPDAMDNMGWLFRRTIGKGAFQGGINWLCIFLKPKLMAHLEDYWLDLANNWLETLTMGFSQLAELEAALNCL